MAETPEPLDAEARKDAPQALIKAGQGGWLPDLRRDQRPPAGRRGRCESIEAIISTFSEMGIRVFDEPRLPKTC